MPSFSDSIFLFILALLLFGPKKLPVLARELGKWIGEFRRASNEFKMQMEEELRQSEQAERQKQIAAMEAAAPLPPPLEPEHPHLRDQPSITDVAAENTTDFGSQESRLGAPSVTDSSSRVGSAGPGPADYPAPLPIATSGSLNIMPPSTGLPTPRSRSEQSSDTLGGLIDAIPETPAVESHQPEVQETAAHG